MGISLAGRCVLSALHPATRLRYLKRLSPHPCIRTLSLNSLSYPKSQGVMKSTILSIRALKKMSRPSNVSGIPTPQRSAFSPARPHVLEASETPIVPGTDVPVFNILARRTPKGSL